MIRRNAGFSAPQLALRLLWWRDSPSNFLSTSPDLSVSGRRRALPGAARFRLTPASRFEPSRSQKIVGAARRIF
jgi:hypothetical protein